MKKFINDVAEVGRDIGRGLYFVFEGTVLFFWSLGVIAEEHGGNLIRYINRYRNRRNAVMAVLASDEVMSNVVGED